MMSRTADMVTAKASQPVVSALGEGDLAEAARIVRVAFGTFIGVPDPENFWSDRDYVYGRQRSTENWSAPTSAPDGEASGSLAH
jgi:hypothetical protein